MHRRLRTVSLSLSFSLALASTTLAPSLVRAEWPMNRHDPQRTGATTNPARLTTPVRAWSTYLGGRIGSDGISVTDVDNDGTRDVVLVSGGRLVVKRPDDSTVWESASYGFSRIVAIEDLDGDRELDVVVTGYPAIVAVFGGRDGRLEWRTSPSVTTPPIGAVRLADFTGDGKRDLYVAEANCGSVGQRGDYAFAYTFGRGYGSGVDDDVTRLWQLERGRDYVCGVNDAVGDVNGDLRADVITYSSNYVWLYDGATGRKISSGNNDGPAYGGYPTGFSIPYGVLASDVVDLNGDGRSELVGYTNNNYDPSINSRSVFVFQFDPSRPPAERFYLRWRAGVASLATDNHAYSEGGAVDLDRDGQYEVVTTFVSATDGPTTNVYRAFTGALLYRFAGASFVGTVDTGEGLPVTMLLRRGGALEGHRFASFASVPVGGTAGPDPAFSIPGGVSPAYFRDAERGQRGSASTQVLTVPEADGTHRALVAYASGEGGVHVQTWALRGEMPERLNDLALGDLTVLAAQPQRDAVAPGEGLVIARNDGVLVVLDRTLTPLNLGDDQLRLPGVRFGGYFLGGCGNLNPPIAARLSGRADSLLVPNSRGELLRLEPLGATRVRPPAVTWRWLGASLPVVHDLDGDGTREIVAAYAGGVAARAADGVTPRWSLAFDLSGERISGDLEISSASSTTTPGGVRVFAQTIDSGLGRGRVYSVNADGTRAFATTPVTTAGSGQGQLGVYDVNADGRDDALISMGAVLHMYSGSDGALLGVHEPLGAITYPHTPINLSGRGGALPPIVAGGAYGVLGAYTIGASPAGASNPYRASTAWNLDTVRYPAGSFNTCTAAVVTCGSGTRVANALLTTPRVVVTDAATGRIIYDVPLANGRTWPSEDALRAEVPNPGQLGNISATQRLDGENPAFVVGSSDGRLYALDACADTPTVRWSLDFRARVGDAIFADTDGDGSDEIIVTSADGYLHAVDSEEFAAPAHVYDTDPPAVTDRDVDEVRGISVSATWAAVPGATAYEWAVFTLEGTAVSQNPMEISNPFVRTTELTATLYERLGNRGAFYFAVRAIGPGGRSSVETLSDGVRFTRPAGPDGGVTEAGAPDGSAPVDAGPSDATLTDAIVPPMDAAADALEASVPADSAIADSSAVESGIADSSPGTDVITASDARPADGGTTPGAGGCGCAVPGSAPSKAPSAAFVGAAVALVVVRRRRRGRG